MLFPTEIFQIILSYNQRLPTLRTITNWRHGSKRFDINELYCAYSITTYDRLVRKVHECRIHDYYLYMDRPRVACTCDKWHTVKSHFPPRLIYNDNYLALWKSCSKGNKLIWQYVDIFQCDNCGEFHIWFDMKEVSDNRYICRCCHGHWGGYFL